MSIRESYLAGGTRPIIDMHGHLGPFHGIYLPEQRLETMAAAMDRYGYERIVLSPHSALSGDTREGNREMIDAVRRYPGRIYGYCTVNPNFPDAMAPELDAYMGEPGVAGVKIHPDMHGYPATGKGYTPLWERANAEGWMVLSHTWGASGGCGAQDMRIIAERYPEVRLLLGHSCYGAWEEALALAADCPHVYLELTAAYHVYGLIEAMCRRAGPEKVVFGTDYPWFDPFTALGCVLFARIDDAAMEAILYGNAKRLLG